MLRKRQKITYLRTSNLQQSKRRKRKMPKFKNIKNNKGFLKLIFKQSRTDKRILLTFRVIYKCALKSKKIVRKKSWACANKTKKRTSPEAKISTTSTKSNLQSVLEKNLTEPTWSSMSKIKSLENSKKKEEMTSWLDILLYIRFVCVVVNLIW